MQIRNRKAVASSSYHSASKPEEGQALSGQIRGASASVKPMLAQIPHAAEVNAELNQPWLGVAG